MCSGRLMNIHHCNLRVFTKSVDKTAAQLCDSKNLNANYANERIFHSLIDVTSCPLGIRQFVEFALRIYDFVKALYCNLPLLEIIQPAYLALPVLFAGFTQGPVERRD
jgi:hypothetical protein